MDHRKRMRSVDTLNNSIDAQSAYSECLVGQKQMEGGAGSRPRGSKRVSRRDQVPTDLQHKRYSSTEAVHNELRSNSIPPLTVDEQSFASASSIPGTPYEERVMPDLAGNADQAAQKPAKVKKSRRTRSASLTNQSQDDDDNPPRRKKVPRVPKVTVSTTVNNNLDDPEKLKPPLPPTAAKKVAEDQSEVGETKPRKKKTKKRTTSKSSAASGNDTLDRSLEDWDKPDQSPNVTIDQAPETLQVSVDATVHDTPTSQTEQLSKPEKKRKKRTTSKSSTASGNTLDKSLEDWNKPNQSPDVDVDQATETQQPSDETTRPVKLNLTPGTDDKNEDSLTLVKDDKKADILSDDNNNDLWDLFGMKLNALCHNLLKGKHGASTDQTQMKNMNNKQIEISPEFIDNEAVVLVENKVEKPSAVTNGVCNDSKLNGLIFTSDDSNDKFPGVMDDLDVEIKPPTGKKKKKQPKALHKESATTIQDRNNEYHLAMNRTHESAVDKIDSSPDIPGSKTVETEKKETPLSVSLKNQSPDIFVPQVQLNAGEKEGNAPTLNFEYDVDGSDQESPKTKEDIQIDLLNFDNDRLKVNSWERKEFEDIMTTKDTTPFTKTPFRISLKPARSEESLAMRTRSETDTVYGRRSELLTATGRLRVARSVDRLNADDREIPVPLIKRRSLSKEWQVVTVTTREEIVLVQKGKNDTKQVDIEPTKQVDIEPRKQTDAENSDNKSSCPKPAEIKYIDSEDSMDMDEDFTWPSPPPLPNNEMPPLTREYAVKQINADVRLVVPLSNGTSSNVDQEMPLIKPSPPRIESTIRSRIEMLSLFGYDKKPKPPDTNTSETQTSSTVEPATPEVPPPLNLDSFPETAQVNSPDISTADVVLQPNNTVENFSNTASTVDTKVTPILGEDEVFSEKGENGGRNLTETETSYDTRSVSQDMSTQTDQTDNSVQFQNNSASPKVALKPVIIPTNAIFVENTDKSTFEFVANSCRPVTKREEKREEPEPQNTYYVVEQNECISPVIIHEYGEMLSFCKKQRSMSEAELNIQKTQQQKLEIQLRLQSLWSLNPQRNTQFAVQQSHESLLSDALNAHLANINAAAASRLAETRATYLLETFRTSPTRDLTSSDVYAVSSKLGMYSRRPFSDSTL